MYSKMPTYFFSGPGLGLPYDIWFTRILKIYMYAHEYQMETVLNSAEKRLHKELKAINCHYQVERRVNWTIDLLHFAEKYGITGLLSEAVNKLSILPKDVIRSVSSYKHLASDLKLMIAEKRLERFDNNQFLKEEN